MYNDRIPPKAPEKENHEEVPGIVKGTFVNYVTEDFGGTDLSTLIGVYLPDTSSERSGMEDASDHTVASIVAMAANDRVADYAVLAFLIGAIVAATTILILELRKNGNRKQSK